MKDKIIYESIKSLRQEGLRFSVDTLAKRLNISKKTVYKYFPNKEALALALYQRYYTDTKAQIEKLLTAKSSTNYSKLLYLYFDAKSMTNNDIFNKYQLNDTLYSYTTKQNDELWNMLLLSFDQNISKTKITVLRIIVDGSFEKLCDEKIAPDDVIDWLVNFLWL